MIRIAAVGEVHLDETVPGRLRPALDNVGTHADVLLLAGDLTRHGTLAEARVVAGRVRRLPIPVVAVLGNHDYHSDAQDEIASLLTDAGITVLEGDGTVLGIDGHRLGVAGVKGFGGGFAGKCGSAFGEPEMKAFIAHTTEVSDRLGRALKGLDADLRVRAHALRGRDRAGRARPRPLRHRAGGYPRGRAGAQRRPTGDPGRVLGVLHWGVAGNYLRASSKLGVSARHYAS